jgi:hypothetical protein
MGKDTDLTVVVFRKYRDGEIIALFPEVDEGRGECSSYMHVGQHGRADYTGVIKSTVPAKPEEFAALRRELEGKPFTYSFRVVARWRRRT